MRHPDPKHLALGAGALLLGAVALAQTVDRPPGKAAAPPSADRAGPGGEDVPRLGAVNRWRNYQLGCWNPLGCVSPREGVVFNAIGPLPGENNVFDGVSYNGYSQFVAERYDNKDGAWTGVGANEVVGGFYGAARMDTGSDPVDAGMSLYTTEFQTTGRNGMGLVLEYTPNGSTALTRGLSISPQGKGGVTVDDAGPQRTADLGPGTLNAASDIQTNGHFRSGGPAPTLSSCGARPTITGGDAAGAVATGGAVSSCVINFAKTYASPPVCIVQTFARATPAAYVASYTTRSITVRWDTPLDGRFFYICQGLS